jgi:hypothetical protein
MMTRSSSRIARRPRPALLALAIAILVPLAWVAWYLGSPLFIDRVVDEPSPIGAAPAAGQPADVKPGSGEPVLLSRGRFGEIDAIHKGEGTATLFTLAGGRAGLQFEEFRVTNGPDLYVYLSGHPAPRDSGQLHEGAALEVARLKGNVGNQSYELPTGLDLSQFKSAVIYCKRFSVVFTTAELAAAS